MNQQEKVKRECNVKKSEKKRKRRVQINLSLIRDDDDDELAKILLRIAFFLWFSICKFRSLGAGFYFVLSGIHTRLLVAEIE